VNGSIGENKDGNGIGIEVVETANDELSFDDLMNDNGNSSSSDVDAIVQRVNAAKKIPSSSSSLPLPLPSNKKDKAEAVAKSNVIIDVAPEDADTGMYDVCMTKDNTIMDWCCQYQ
jgi:hypothetical protein